MLSKPGENPGTKRPGKKRRESSSFKWIRGHWTSRMTEWVFCACSKFLDLIQLAENRLNRTSKEDR